MNSAYNFNILTLVVSKMKSWIDLFERVNVFLSMRPVKAML